MPVHKVNYKDKIILIVEDIPSNFQLLEAYLAPTGARIIHATNGSTAYEIFRSRTDINLVLMDLRLPDTNGLAVTKMIRRINTSVPIVAQTAYAMPTDRMECLTSGCNDYIAKPIRRADFLHVIGKYVQSA